MENYVVTFYATASGIWGSKVFYANVTVFLVKVKLLFLLLLLITFGNELKNLNWQEFAQIQDDALFYQLFFYIPL